ncbi:MAG: hypothetical protein R6X02_00380 [Enhygromyxa sp.]
MTWLRPLLVVPLLALALGVGCDDAEQLRALDLAELPERFACDDVTVVAASPEGSEALLIGVQDGLVAAARESGESVEAEYELPDDRLVVRWVSGSNVYAGHCGRDSGEQWQLDQRRDAIAGHIAIRIEPSPDGGLSVSASLDDLLLAPSRADAGPAYELSTTALEGLPLPQ